jgi:drug/metabolite transporter (DMT)-like permease
MKSRDVAAYIFLAIVWGASFVVLLQSVLVFGWVGAAAFRSLIAAATLYALARLSHRPWFSVRDGNPSPLSAPRSWCCSSACRSQRRGSARP